MLPMQNLRAADLLNVYCSAQKECCLSFSAEGCANIIVPVQGLLWAPEASAECLYGNQSLPYSRW